MALCAASRKGLWNEESRSGGSASAPALGDGEVCVKCVGSSSHRKRKHPMLGMHENLKHQMTLNLVHSSLSPCFFHQLTFADFACDSALLLRVVVGSSATF